MIKNKYKITLTSFMAYFIMSSVITPLGIVTKPISEHYGISITSATADFGYLTFGLMFGTVISFFIFDLLRIRTIIVSFSLSICVSLAGMYFVDLYSLFPVWLFIIGIACGVNMTAAIIVISAVYESNLRASMLLLTDSFYSIAGVISSFLAGKFIVNNLHWASAYFLAFVVALIIASIALTSNYPHTARSEKKETVEYSNARWPLGFFLIGGAILIYLVGFVSIYSWIPNYTQAEFGIDAEMSSALVSRFFTGLFIGQLIMFWLVLNFSPTKVMLISSVLATLLTTMLWNAGTVSVLNISMFALGLITGGMFKLIISFGTTLVKSASPRMISYLVLNSAIGTAIAPAVSSYIVEQFGMNTVLQFVSLCYCIMILLISTAYMLQTRTVVATNEA